MSQAPLTEAGFFELMKLVDPKGDNPPQQMLDTFGPQRSAELLCWFTSLYIRLHDKWRASNKKASLTKYRQTEKVAMWVVVQGKDTFNACLDEPNALEILVASFEADKLFYVPPPNTEFLKTIAALNPQPS